MSYKINPSVYASAFVVPTSVVDDNIKMAGPAQLKTLLWVLRHPAEEYDFNVIAKAINYKPEDVRDAMIFWAERGIFISESDEVTVAKVEPAAVKAAPTEKKLPEIKPTGLSYEQIEARCKESPEIRAMFNDIQKVLGKTIGYNGQSVLLTLHDGYGLPIEVIYMLVEYCASVGKTAFSYIAKVGKDWGEKEIDTIEKADEQIATLNACNGVWREFASLAGIQNPRPTAAQSAYIRTWTTEMKFNVEMIYLAYEETLDHSGKISFPYMNKVLANWHSKGLKTPEAVEKEKEEYRSKSVKKKESSYDMDEFKRRADKLPVYKKS